MKRGITIAGKFARTQKDAQTDTENRAYRDSVCRYTHQADRCLQLLGANNAEAVGVAYVRKRGKGRTEEEAGICVYVCVHVCVCVCACVCICMCLSVNNRFHEREVCRYVPVERHRKKQSEILLRARTEGRKNMLSSSGCAKTNSVGPRRPLRALSCRSCGVGGMHKTQERFSVAQKNPHIALVYL